MDELVGFDHFTINRTERRLYKDGAPVAVSSAGLRLLLALVERQGQVVTKDELMTQVWGSSPITENALHVQVTALRRTIGSEFIITRSGIGYRFVGEVRPPASPRPVVPPGRKQHRRVARGLLGRDTQLRELAKLLSRTRFVTLTGPGGVGKTSLARALVEEISGDYPDGWWFVELAMQRDHRSFLETVGAALSVDDGFDASSSQALVARLTGRRALLVLDNCEHLLVPIAELAEALFANALGLDIVTTSRQALACLGEHVFNVPPLALPEPAVMTVRQGRRASAFRLFTDRIWALEPSFVVEDDQVGIAARICRSLDGLPLALEIVASWASVLGLEALEEKLNAAPIAWPHPRAAAPSRHYDLRTTLEWSHELLSDAERVVLRRAAVFAQSFTLRAAEPILGCARYPQESCFGHLASLVQKSLAAVRGDRRPPTYRLLETTRAFALEKLRASGEEDEVRLRHAQNLLRMLIAAEQEWDTRSSAAWMAAHAGVIADVREALEWSVGKQANLEAGVAIAAASWPLWRELSLRVEGGRRLQAALTIMPADTPAPVEALLRFGLAMMHSDSDWHFARAAFENAARLYRQLGDRNRLGRTLQHLAFTLFLLGDVQAAERFSEEARGLLEGLGSQRALAAVYVIQLVLLSHRHDYEAARRVGLQAVRLYEAMGAERSAFTSRSNLLDVALCKDDVQTAIAEGRVLAAQLRATAHSAVLGIVMVNLVAALVRAGQFDESLREAREAARLLPQNRPLVVLLDHLALRCAMMGQMGDAALLSGFTNRAYHDLAIPRQHVEQLAAERLRVLLDSAMPTATIAQLEGDGRLLTEAGAWSVASREDSIADGPC